MKDEKETGPQVRRDGWLVRQRDVELLVEDAIGGSAHSVSNASRRALMRKLAVGGGLALLAPVIKPLTNAAQAAGAEEAHFRQNILTPSGTALGGFVDLTLRSDGTYNAHFHMHDSGVPDYKFEVRALFAAANGLVFAWQHSGRVEGTSSTKLTRGPHRNNEADIQGVHPLIRQFWPAVRTGKLAVSKEYSPTGVVGFVQDAARVVLDVAGGAARGTVGAVVGLGDEMVRTLNSLQLGGTVGIVGGVAVLASGGSMVMAVASGVGAGRMTKALVRQRQMNAQEAAFAAQVFGGTLPPANRIILTNLNGLGGRGFTMPGASADIFVNIGSDAYEHPTTHVDRAYPAPGQLLIHELTHAWQIHHQSFAPGWVCSGLVVQAGNTFGDSAYQYGAPDRPWGKFESEQQGAIVDQWFGGSRVRGQKRMDPSDPYFRYIRDNIRVGRT